MDKKKKFWVILGLVIFVVVDIAAVIYARIVRPDNVKPGMTIEDDKDSEGQVDVETELTDGVEGAAESRGETGVEKVEPVVEKIATEVHTEQNSTLGLGRLMLINPNFVVSTDWIANRKAQLVNITEKYGIREGNAGNGVPLMDAEAAAKLNEMLVAYSEVYHGHEMTTRSCFRERGTNCGRLCYATGTSDHHSGYTCDLIDASYGNELNTDLLVQHPEWQWLKENSWKYGFIDRFPALWAGGSMSEPVNVDANGTTGLYEVWHYRYVGMEAAEEIASGKYNGGQYDSLEHYLLATGRVERLK